MLYMVVSPYSKPFYKVIIMKIDNSYTNQLPLANNNASVTRQNNKADEPATSEVKLSGIATSISREASSSAPVNQARIDELRKAISSGQFKINPDAIADRLLETAKELVQTQRRA